MASSGTAEAKTRSSKPRPSTQSDKRPRGERAKKTKNNTQDRDELVKKVQEVLGYEEAAARLACETRGFDGQKVLEFIQVVVEDGRLHHTNVHDEWQAVETKKKKKPTDTPAAGPSAPSGGRGEGEGRGRGRGRGDSEGRGRGDSESRGRGGRGDGEGRGRGRGGRGRGDRPPRGDRTSGGSTASATSVPAPVEQTTTTGWDNTVAGWDDTPAAGTAWTAPAAQPAPQQQQQQPTSESKHRSQQQQHHSRADNRSQQAARPAPAAWGGGKTFLEIVKQKPKKELEAERLALEALEAERQARLQEQLEQEQEVARVRHQEEERRKEERRIQEEQRRRAEEEEHARQQQQLRVREAAERAELAARLEAAEKLRLQEEQLRLQQEEAHRQEQEELAKQEAESQRKAAASRGGRGQNYAWKPVQPKADEHQEDYDLLGNAFNSFAPKPLHNFEKPVALPPGVLDSDDVDIKFGKPKVAPVHAHQPHAEAPTQAEAPIQSADDSTEIAAADEQEGASQADAQAHDPAEAESKKPGHAEHFQHHPHQQMHPGQHAGPHQYYPQQQMYEFQQYPPNFMQQSYRSWTPEEQMFYNQPDGYPHGQFPFAQQRAPHNPKGRPPRQNRNDRHDRGNRNNYKNKPEAQAEVPGKTQGQANQGRQNPSNPQAQPYTGQKSFPKQQVNYQPTQQYGGYPPKTAFEQTPPAPRPNQFKQPYQADKVPAFTQQPYAAAGTPYGHMYGHPYGYYPQFAAPPPQFAARPMYHHYPSQGFYPQHGAAEGYAEQYPAYGDYGLPGKPADAAAVSEDAEAAPAENPNKPKAGAAGTADGNRMTNAYHTYGHQQSVPSGFHQPHYNQSGFYEQEHAYDQQPPWQ